MNNSGKNKRPTTIAYIVLFALSGCTLAVGVILQATSLYDAAKVMLIFVTPALFVAAVIVALIDTHLNQSLSAQDKSRITKGVFKTFGCGITTALIITVIPIIILISIWLLLLIGYGSA